MATSADSFNRQQVQGTVVVTHSGIVILEVESIHGKVPLRLTNVLFIESMEFNILSLQKLVTSNSLQYTTRSQTRWF